MRAWPVLVALATLACSTPPSAADAGSAIDATGGPRDAGPRDAPAPPDAGAPDDVGHDASALDAFAPPRPDVGIDAATFVPYDGGSPEAGCEQAWCTCSTWPGRVVGTDRGAVRVVSTSQGLALVSDTGVDWLDAAGEVVRPLTPWAELPAWRAVQRAAAGPHALAVLAGPPSAGLTLIDSSTHATLSPLHPYTSAPFVPSHAIVALGEGFAVAWSDGTSAWAVAVAADGALGAVHGLGTGREVALGEVGGLPTALVAGDDVRLQPLDASAAPLGSPIALATGRLSPTQPYLTAPALVGDADGWYVAWAEQRDDVPRYPFGEDLKGMYVLAHVALDGTIDTVPTDVVPWWLLGTIELALDDVGRLAMLLLSAPGDDGDFYEVHFLARDASRWRPALAPPAVLYATDLEHDPDTNTFVVGVLEHDGTTRLWSICALP